MLQLYLLLLETEEEKDRFSLLYEQYKKLMHYAANRLLHDDQLAEDAVQEAFFRIAKNFSGVGEIDCPQTKSFVVIITERVALTMLKKNKRQREAVPLEFTYDDEEGSGQTIEPAQPADDSVFDAVSHHALVQEILALPKIYREALYLYGYFGYGLAEVAQLLEITEDAARKRVQRARGLLQSRLKGGEEDE